MVPLTKNPHSSKERELKIIHTTYNKENGSARQKVRWCPNVLAPQANIRVVNQQIY
jgi:hypothetical protein